MAVTHREDAVPPDQTGPVATNVLVTHVDLDELMELYEDEVFIRPPEAPIFTPSVSEFADPISYIATTVRPVLEKTGICKVRPPEDWQPPFAVDVENFTFQPRVQKINELEATTRVKLQFLNKLFKFWDLQGVVLKVPTVNRKPLDFHKLHKLVQEEGGYEQVTLRHRWNHVANKRMHLPALVNKCYGSALRQHYEKYLYPFDLFEAGIAYDYKAAHKAIAKHDKKSPKKEPGDNVNSPQIKKLQYYGAGRKTTLPDIKPEGDSQDSEICTRRAMRDRSKASYLESDICQICSLTDNEGQMLTCSNCEEVYHKYCLISKVQEVIEGDWRCPRCVAKEYKKPTEVYGFDTSTKLYTLATFGAMADRFKENYFNKPTAEVSCEEVEQEFWRLTKNINECVTVQYGADIHALTNGSGFPTKVTDELNEEDEKYIHSKWNLNNLPVDEGSVLRYVSGDVSGMKVPWCYVGMCFSSFCWHIEDHWSYSINYHHWGEPKTWYGVPSSHAEALEEVMRSGAPELFEQSPDLLHHITTIMNPDVLMSHDIPVVRTDQCAGEFVITAPRSFHAGFNQGYNFAEAVNFCPADWLPMGRASINNYKKVKRYCVFSHEELVCKLAADADSLDLLIAVEAHKELLAMVDQERKLRKKLLEHGVSKAEREKFELKPDDERQCCYCKTTCFLSAITCPCKSGKLACIEHIGQMCHCSGSKKVLRYRYTLDELPAMIRSLGGRVEAYNKWTVDCQQALSANGADRVEFTELKKLLSEAKEKGYPHQLVLFSELQNAVKAAEKCFCQVKEAVNRRARSRRHTELAVKSAARRLSLSDVSDLIGQLQTLHCVSKDSQLLEELMSKANQFRNDAKTALARPSPQRQTLHNLLEAGLSLDLDMEEIGVLEHAIKQSEWLEEVAQVMDKEEDELVTIEQLEDLAKRGHTLPIHPDVDKVLADMEHKLKIGLSWEEKAMICLQAKPKHSLRTIQAMLSESEGIKVYLPNIESLRDYVDKSMDWIAKAQDMLRSLPHPALEQLKNLVSRSRALPVKMDILQDVTAVIDNAEQWKEEACSHFIKETHSVALLDVLLPRHTPISPRPRHLSRKTVRQQKRENPIDSDKLIDNRFATNDMYEKAIDAEMTTVRQLRLANEGASRVCQCEEPDGDMFQCELCREWRHYECCGLAEQSPNEDSSTLAPLLCLACVRSKRPKLNVILQLLMSLKKIPARFVEGEALQLLTERIINWQQKVKTFTSSQTFSLLNKKFSALIAKNTYWANQEEEEVDDPYATDHDYITSHSPSRVVHPVFDVPDIEPDEEFCNQLDSLLLEGHLLEVTVAETTQLSLFLRTLQRYKVDRLAVDCKKRKSTSNTKESSTGAATQEDDISSTTSSTENVKPETRKRKTKSEKGRKKKKLNGGTVEIVEKTKDDWGEYDEKCAAAFCELPTGDSIGWVQCDECELWFHFVCVGENPNDLADNDYHCTACHSSRTYSSGCEEDALTGEMISVQNKPPTDYIVCEEDLIKLNDGSISPTGSLFSTHSVMSSGSAKFRQLLTADLNSL